jgi:hypothetical protein
LILKTSNITLGHELMSSSNLVLYSWLLSTAWYEKKT